MDTQWRFSRRDVAGNRNIAAQAGDALRMLLTGYTLEITPAQADRISAFSGLVASCTGVHVTALPGAVPARLVDAAERLAAEGLRPIPHIAARGFRRLADVDELLAALSTRAGVDEVLVVAGSQPRPVGSVDSSLQVLASGLLQQHEIRRVGVAGHPEGHPAVGAAALMDAIAEKNRFASESGIETYIVTQFCFSADVYVRYEYALRAAGNRLPVRAGIPGVASASTLFRYALACGIGPSLQFLRTQTRGFTSLLRPRSYTPTPLVAGIAEAVAAEPGTLFAPLHLYPFGALEPTVRWATEALRATAVE